MQRKGGVLLTALFFMDLSVFYLIVYSYYQYRNGTIHSELGPEEILLPFETKTSRPTELKLAELESNIFLVGHSTSRDSEWSHFLSHPLITELMNPAYERNHTRYWTLVQSIYCLLDSPDPALHSVVTYLTF